MSPRPSRGHLLQVIERVHVRSQALVEVTNARLAREGRHLLWLVVVVHAEGEHVVLLLRAQPPGDPRWRIRPRCRACDPRAGRPDRTKLLWCLQSLHLELTCRRRSLPPTAKGRQGILRQFRRLLCTLRPDLLFRGGGGRWSRLCRCEHSCCTVLRSDHRIAVGPLAQLARQLRTTLLHNERRNHIGQV